jgi:hypothetical protein
MLSVYAINPVAVRAVVRSEHWKRGFDVFKL